MARRLNGSTMNTFEAPSSESRPGNGWPAGSPRRNACERRGRGDRDTERFMRPLANQRHERFAQALAEGKTATAAYVLAGYKANDGNASRMKGNERISARIQEIVGRAAERAEVSLERVLRELKAIAF